MRIGSFLVLGLLVIAPVLSGCVEEGEADTSNFRLEPQRVGWNAGDVARFTLSIQETRFSKNPEYTVDRDFAIAEVELDARGVGLGGDYRTRNADDVDLRLYRNGTLVEEAPLDSANSSVDLTLRLPENLKDAEYVLALRLFEVGWVTSEPFRVNVP